MQLTHTLKVKIINPQLWTLFQLRSSVGPIRTSGNFGFESDYDFLRGFFSSFTLFFPTWHHCHQFFSLVQPLGKLHLHVYHWGWLKIGKTLEFESGFEFLRGFLNSFSGTDVQGLSPNPWEDHWSPCAVSVLLSWAGLLTKREIQYFQNITWISLAAPNAPWGSLGSSKSWQTMALP